MNGWFEGGLLGCTVGNLAGDMLVLKVGGIVTGGGVATAVGSGVWGFKSKSGGAG